MLSAPRRKTAAHSSARSVGLACALWLSFGPGLLFGQAAQPIISVSKSGVFELAPDGKQLRRISTTPAIHARFLPGQRQLVLLTERGDKQQLRILDLDTGQERLLASIPLRFPSNLFYKDPYEPSLDLRLQAPGDFRVDAASACLVVMDRNINMMNATARLHIDLKTGKLSTEPAACYGGTPSARCKKAPADSLRCDAPYVIPEPPQGPKEGFPFREEKGKLLARQQDGTWKTRSKLADFEPERLSPSGRFVLLAGRRDSGDYVYRTLLALDLQTGEILDLGKNARALPAARIGDAAGRTVVGEDEVYFLAGPDRLIVGTTLFGLAERSARHVGSLAR